MSDFDDWREVVATVNRYGTALDRKDWALLERVFTRDAVGDYGFAVEGRRAIVEMIQGMLGGCGPTQHLLGNHEVELEGDRARARCVIRAHHLGSGDAEGQSYECFGEYRDELVRTPEGWRIARRTMRVSHEIGTRDVLGPA